MPTPKKYTNTAARVAAYRERQRIARQNELAAKGLPAAPPISTLPSAARWNALQQSARASIETMRDEMETYHGERTESWQDGERGVAFQEKIDSINDLLETLDALNDM